jgi:hypothetical protein
MRAWCLLPALAAAIYPIDRGAIADVVVDLGGKWALSSAFSFGRGNTGAAIHGGRRNMRRTVLALILSDARGSYTRGPSQHAPPSWL